MCNPDYFVIISFAVYAFMWFIFSFSFFVYVIIQVRKNGIKQVVKNIFGRTWGIGTFEADGFEVFMEIVFFGIFWPIISIHFLMNKLSVVNSPKR